MFSQSNTKTILGITIPLVVAGAAVTTYAIYRNQLISRLSKPNLSLPRKKHIAKVLGIPHAELKEAGQTLKAVKLFFRSTTPLRVFELIEQACDVDDNFVVVKNGKPNKPIKPGSYIIQINQSSEKLSATVILEMNMMTKVADFKQFPPNLTQMPLPYQKIFSHKKIQHYLLDIGLMGTTMLDFTTTTAAEKARHFIIQKSPFIKIEPQIKKISGMKDNITEDKLTVPTWMSLPYIMEFNDFIARRIPSKTHRSEESKAEKSSLSK